LGVCSDNLLDICGLWSPISLMSFSFWIGTCINFMNLTKIKVLTNGVSFVLLNLLGCWRRQLMMAKDTMRVETVCYSVSLCQEITFPYPLPDLKMQGNRWILFFQIHLSGENCDLKILYLFIILFKFISIHFFFALLCRIYLKKKNVAG